MTPALDGDRTTTGDRDLLLVLGASGFVGRRLYARLGRARAVATYNRHPIAGAVHFDALSMRLDGAVRDLDRVSHAVVLLGDTDPESCAADLARSTKLNVDSITGVLDDLQTWGIMPIFFSSEFVFGGEKGGYVEDDPTNPILAYGRQKAEVEQVIARTFDEFVIFRLAKTFGDRRGDGTLFTNWLDAIERSTTITCAADQRFSPIFVDDVIEATVRAIAGRHHGVFHLCGPRGYRRIELLELLLDALRPYRPSNVKVVPTSIRDFQLREPRPLDVSMLPDKLVKTFGMALTDPAHVCRCIAAAEAGQPLAREPS